MTVAASSSSKTVTVIAGTTGYVPPTPYCGPGTLAAWSWKEANGTLVQLTEGTDWSYASGFVTLSSSAAESHAGESLVLIRTLPMTQGMAVPLAGRLDSVALEKALDDAALRDQQLQEQADRSLKIPLGMTCNMPQLFQQFVHAISVVANIENLDVTSVTTGEPGTNASVTLTDHRHLSFTIPRGATGATGATGPQGPAGATGASGAQGPAGPANTLSIGTVVSGSTASASITGAAPTQTLNLTLPKGDKGADGKSSDKLPVVSVVQQQGEEEFLVANSIDPLSQEQYVLYYGGTESGGTFSHPHIWRDENSQNWCHSAERQPSEGATLYDAPFGVGSLFTVDQYYPAEPGEGSFVIVSAGTAYRWSLSEMPGTLYAVNIPNNRSVIPIHLEFSGSQTPEIIGSSVTIPQTLESGDYEVYYDGVSESAVLRKAGASSGGGSASWGSISGTLSAQTDLQTALDAKQGTLTAGGGVTIAGSTISAYVQDVQVDGQSVASGGTASISTSALVHKFTGFGPPTTATVGSVGDLYTDTATNYAYECVSVAGSTYTWRKLGAEYLPLSGGNVMGVLSVQNSIINYAQYINVFITLPASAGTVEGNPYQLGDGVYKHAPSAPATYTFPNISDNTTHEVVLYLDLATTASFTFQDAGGTGIVPKMSFTPAVGDKVTALCRWEFGAWQVYLVRTEEASA